MTKAILDESCDEKTDDKILVVEADIEKDGKKVSCLETIVPSEALARIRY